jgi:hypothetical protein
MNGYLPLPTKPAGLPDERLQDRLSLMVDTFTQKPNASIPQATGNRNDMEATYDFFDNQRVRPSVIVAECLPQTLELLHGCSRILAVQDSTDINYDHLQQTTGLGYTDGANTRGLKVHTMLAVRSDGLPVGILSQQIWIRPFDAKGKADKRRQRQAADKESFRWNDHAQAANAALPKHVTVIHIADREGDIYDWFAATRPAHAHLLVRVAQFRRNVASQADGTVGHLEDILAKQPSLGTTMIDVPRADERPPRQAQLTLRIASVHLQPPHNALQRSQLPEVPVWLIEASEEGAPAGAVAIRWCLVTTEPVATLADALRALREYKLRWLIERFHFTLKSGLRVEQLELETADRLGNAVAVYSQTAARILRLTYSGRVEPEASASEEFSAPELKILEGERDRRSKRRCGPIVTLREALAALGHLGGHLGRKGDGPPGLKVLWRGLMALHQRLLGFLQATQSEPDS